MKIIITGASSGIGRGIATVLGRAGHDLGLIARSATGLAETKQTCDDGKARCFTVSCDIRDPEATSAAATSLIQELGGIDALINNAGVIIRKDIFDLSIEEWSTMVDTNISGLFYITRAIVPQMRKQQAGHVINISSISGKLPLPGGSGYAATKYAVTGFSQSLFHEVRDYGIKVTTIFPGSVDTGAHRRGNAGSAAWKVTPKEVGEACLDILNTSSTNCISEIEIRPLKKPV